MKILPLNKWVGKMLAAIAFLSMAALSTSGVKAPAPTHVTPAVTAPQIAEPVATTTPIKKVLFIGDSMTGWMAERLNAYGDINGFEVATVVWDGSTITKWANSPKLKQIISQNKPDAIFVSLGMNELFTRNPQKQLKASIDKLKAAFGDTPLLWVGPPSWPGRPGGEVLNSWLPSEVGEGNFFRSAELSIPRQSKSNPHPSRKGIEQWMDKVVEWIPENSNLNFQSLNKPAAGKFSRGKTFIYKRMRETL